MNDDGSAPPSGQEPADQPELSEQLGELLAVIWAKVVGQVNKLIDAHRDFGFVQFNAGLNPNLAQVLSALEVVDSALTQFLNSGMLGFDERRNAINSKQCILKMKSLNLALNETNEVEFEKIIAELKNQSKF